MHFLTSQLNCVSVHHNIAIMYQEFVVYVTIIWLSLKKNKFVYVMKMLLFIRQVNVGNVIKVRTLV